MPVAAALAARALDALALPAGARLVVRGSVDAGPLAVAVAREAVGRGVRPTFALGLADGAPDPLLDEAPQPDATLVLVTTPAGLAGWSPCATRIAGDGARLGLVAPTDALAQAAGRPQVAFAAALAAGEEPALLAPTGPPAPAPIPRLQAGDLRMDRVARVVVERMLGLLPAQRVLISGHAAGLPLAERIARRALAAGAVPCVRLVPEGLEAALLEAPEDVLAASDPIELHAWQTTHALVRVTAQANAHALADVPAARLAALARGRAPLREAHLGRSAAGRLRWAVVLCPCPSLAEEAGLDLEAYADLVYGAAFADLDDPVVAWEAQAARQSGLVATLTRTRELRFVAPGTDVRLRVDGRTWRSSAANRNLPDGEVFTGPLEDSAEGVVEFTYPIAKSGRVVEGIRLVFAAGRVVEATARRGQDVLLALLDQDAGARRLGEVGIGTNHALGRFTGQILLDEKLGGTFHLAVGAGYPETGSTNRSGEHWDMICDLRTGGEILADGVPIQRDGVFLPASGYGA